MVSTADNEAPTSRVEHVYSHLREGIVEGRFAAGAHLNAANIASSLSISVIPVREAIRLLEAEGLVTIQPNRGAMVQEMSIDDLEDLYLTRLTLETDALRRSLPNLTEEDIDRVDEALRQMTDAYDEHDVGVAMTWHRRFHDGLYSRSGSRRLPHLIDTLWSASDRYLWISPQLFHHDNFRSDHEPILLAVRERDVERAVEALRVHHEVALARIHQTTT